VPLYKIWFEVLFLIQKGKGPWSTPDRTPMKSIDLHDIWR
jgi:hypothetical protein